MIPAGSARGMRATTLRSLGVFRRIPEGFNAITWAIEHAPALTGEERAELAASIWASIADMGDEISDDWRQQAGAHLLALADERDERDRAALKAQLASASADLLDELIPIVRSPRFDAELPEDLRPIGRALCARSWIRALALEIEP
jgi:hypothetical protein